LGDLQNLLYAAGTHAMLVVLQGMDTSGKDGALRSVFSEVDRRGCAPSPSSRQPRSSSATIFSGGSTARRPSGG
jgi:polyphosphate kinase 2 (PPK2 family)